MIENYLKFLKPAAIKHKTVRVEKSNSKTSDAV
jgi:hypothetical protein